MENLKIIIGFLVINNQIKFQIICFLKVWPADTIWRLRKKKVRVRVGGKEGPPFCQLKHQKIKSKETNFL